MLSVYLKDKLKNTAVKGKTKVTNVVKNIAKLKQN